jgi:hypothetical protein
MFLDIVGFDTVTRVRKLVTSAIVRLLGIFMNCGEEEGSRMVAEPKEKEPLVCKCKIASDYVAPPFSEFFSAPDVIEKSKRTIMNIVCFVYQMWGGSAEHGLEPENDINSVASAAMILYNQLTSFPTLGDWTEDTASLDIRVALACCVCTAFKFEVDEEIPVMSLQVVYQVMTPKEQSIPTKDIRRSIKKYELFICTHCRVMNAVYDNPASIARIHLFDMESEGRLQPPSAELATRNVFFFYYNLHTEMSQFLFVSNERDAGMALALVVLACMKSIVTDVLLTGDCATTADFKAAADMARATWLKGSNAQASIGGVYTNEVSLDCVLTKADNLAKAYTILRDLQ